MEYILLYGIYLLYSLLSMTTQKFFYKIRGSSKKKKKLDMWVLINNNVIFI